MASESHLAPTAALPLLRCRRCRNEPSRPTHAGAWPYRPGLCRSFELRKNGDLEARLLGLGIELKPQDGSAVTSAIDRFVYTSAVEADTPEMLRRGPWAWSGSPAAPARGGAGRRHAGRGHRGHSRQEHYLRDGGVGSCARPGCPPQLLGGSALVGEGSAGCFVAAPPSARSFRGGLRVRRIPCGLPGGDRPPPQTSAAITAKLEVHASAVRDVLPPTAEGSWSTARCPEAAGLGREFKAVSYGASPTADVPLAVVGVGPDRACGVLRAPVGTCGSTCRSPALHNLENAAAAALVAIELGMLPGAITTLLSRFPGVARRFEVVGTTDSGIRVVDDYAHNGEKASGGDCDGSGRVATSGRRLPAAWLRPRSVPASRAEGAAAEGACARRTAFCYAEIFYAAGPSRGRLEPRAGSRTSRRA